MKKNKKIIAQNWFNRGYFIDKPTPPLSMKTANPAFKKLWKEENDRK